MYCSKGIILSGEVSSPLFPSYAERESIFQKVLHKNREAFRPPGCPVQQWPQVWPLSWWPQPWSPQVLLTVVMVAGGCIGADQRACQQFCHPGVRVALVPAYSRIPASANAIWAPPPMPPQIRAST